MATSSRTDLSANSKDQAIKQIEGYILAMGKESPSHPDYPFMKLMEKDSEKTYSFILLKMILSYQKDKPESYFQWLQLTYLFVDEVSYTASEEILFELAKCYRLGQGTPVDYAKAIEVYQKILLQCAEPMAKECYIFLQEIINKKAFPASLKACELLIPVTSQHNIHRLVSQAVDLKSIAEENKEDDVFKPFTSALESYLKKHAKKLSWKVKDYRNLITLLEKISCVRSLIYFCENQAILDSSNLLSDDNSFDYPTRLKQKIMTFQYGTSQTHETVPKEIAIKAAKMLWLYYDKEHKKHPKDIILFNLYSTYFRLHHTISKTYERDYSERFPQLNFCPTVYGIWDKSDSYYRYIEYTQRVKTALATKSYIKWHNGRTQTLLDQVDIFKNVHTAYICLSAAEAYTQFNEKRSANFLHFTIENYWQAYNSLTKEGLDTEEVFFAVEKFQKIHEKEISADSVASRCLQTLLGRMYVKDPLKSLIHRKNAYDCLLSPPSESKEIKESKPVNIPNNDPTKREYIGALHDAAEYQLSKGNPQEAAIHYQTLKALGNTKACIWVLEQLCNKLTPSNLVEARALAETILACPVGIPDAFGKKTTSFTALVKDLPNTHPLCLQMVKNITQRILFASKDEIEDELKVLKKLPFPKITEVANAFLYNHDSLLQEHVAQEDLVGVLFLARLWKDKHRNRAAALYISLLFYLTDKTKTNLHQLSEETIKAIKNQAYDFLKNYPKKGLRTWVALHVSSSHRALPIVEWYLKTYPLTDKVIQDRIYIIRRNDIQKCMPPHIAKVYAEIMLSCTQGASEEKKVSRNNNNSSSSSSLSISVLQQPSAPVEELKPGTTIPAMTSDPSSSSTLLIMQSSSIPSAPNQLPTVLAVSTEVQSSLAPSIIPSAPVLSEEKHNLESYELEPGVSISTTPAIASDSSSSSSMPSEVKLTVVIDNANLTSELEPGRYTPAIISNWNERRKPIDEDEEELKELEERKKQSIAP